MTADGRIAGQPPRTPARRVLAMPVTPGGEQVEQRFGRTPDIVVAQVEAGEITGWHVRHVGWDVLHDQGAHGQHHARIARFMRDHEVDAVAATHMPEMMAHMLGRLGLSIVVSVPAGMPARDAVLAVAAHLDSVE